MLIESHKLRERSADNFETQDFDVERFYFSGWAGPNFPAHKTPMTTSSQQAVHVVGNETLWLYFIVFSSTCCSLCGQNESNFYCISFVTNLMHTDV